MLRVFICLKIIEVILSPLHPRRTVQSEHRDSVVALIAYLYLNEGSEIDVFPSADGSCRKFGVSVKGRTGVGGGFRSRNLPRRMSAFTCIIALALLSYVYMFCIFLSRHLRFFFHLQVQP